MRSNFFWLTAFVLWILLAIFSLYPIFLGNIPFWYDPARDLLSAWNNLSKITLIGPTTGIPGIFYGPYWIWFLSIPLIFSKDPRFVTLIASFIPYMLFLPFLLSKFKEIFSRNIILVLWTIFVLSFQSYIIFIWNPNNSLLFFLLAIYLLLSVASEKLSSGWRKVVLAGLSAGLALNINFSFGSVFALSSILFLVLNTSFLVRANFKKKIRMLLSQLGSFVIGITGSFLPFFVFQFRHGFAQLEVALDALLSGGGGIVNIHGLTKQQIVEGFFLRWSQLLHVPFFTGLIILAILIVVIAVLALRRRNYFSKLEKSLLLLIVSLMIGCLGLYLSVRNPVWDYHFIGVEVVWILVLGIILTKLPLIRFTVYGWAFILIIMQTINFARSLQVSALTADSLANKRYVVETISNDAKNKAYTVYAYSPSIYIYEYTYLFRWLANRDVPYDPSMTELQRDVYLILPNEKKPVIEDFVNYRTPSKNYSTVRVWNIPDGKIVLKRSLVQ